MNLKEYTEAVNAVARKRVDQLNAEYRAGKRLFGASHSEFPEAMIAPYHKAGLSPEQAHTEILASL
jgi:hypothetical protein